MSNGSNSPPAATGESESTRSWLEVCFPNRRLSEEDRRFVETQIRDTAIRLRTPNSARALWIALTDDERRRLGNYTSLVVGEDGALGMWMRLYSVTEPTAVLQLAERIGSMLPETIKVIKNRLCISGPTEEQRDVPRWDRDTGELWFRDQVVRAVSSLSNAPNVVAVLDAFEQEGWPQRIDDPLPDGRNQTRLHRTINILNERLALLRFSADGTGQGIRWRRM